MTSYPGFLASNECVQLDYQIISQVASADCGQSYKHFTLVNYDSRVVIWGIFQSGMTLES